MHLWATPIRIGFVSKTAAYHIWATSKKKLSYALVSLIIGVILGSIIAWLFKDCSSFNQSTVYGPPPVDTTQTISPVNNE